MLVFKNIEVECILSSKGYPVVYFETSPHKVYYTDLFSYDTCDEQILSTVSRYIRDVYDCDCVNITIKRVCSYDAKIK